MKRCILIAMVITSVIAFCDDEPEWKALEKQIIQKRGELKKLRNRNPAYILGDEKQPVFLRKRMPNPGETKYYVKQVVDVRPFCVCEHAALKDGGTTARHPKRMGKRSLDRSSTDYTCTESELCPAWKQWRDAKALVEETSKMNEEIDPVADELKALEEKLKMHLEEKEKERREKRRIGNKSSSDGNNAAKGGK